MSRLNRAFAGVEFASASADGDICVADFYAPRGALQRRVIGDLGWSQRMAREFRDVDVAVES